MNRCDICGKFRKWEDLAYWPEFVSCSKYQKEIRECYPCIELRRYKENAAI